MEISRALPREGLSLWPVPQLPLQPLQQLLGSVGDSMPGMKQSAQSAAILYLTCQPCPDIVVDNVKS